MQKRLLWLDMAKGYGILMVIWAHIQRDSMLATWFYSFHIPLFFVCSGYVFSAKSDFGMFLKKKVKSTLLPYFYLGIPMVIFICFRKQYTEQECLSLIKEFVLQQRMTSLWFLACLFFLNLLFYAALKILKSDIGLAIFSVIAIGVGLCWYRGEERTLFWNIDACLMAFPFFFAGYLYRKHGEKIDKYLEDKELSPILLLFFFLVNIGFEYLSYYFSGSGLEMYHCSYGIPLYTYLSAFAGVICVFIISKRSTIKPIEYIGRNSLLFFAWHTRIIMPISRDILSLLHISENLTLVHDIFYFILILLLCTICNEILSRTKWKFMLGK